MYRNKQKSLQNKLKIDKRSQGVQNEMRGGTNHNVRIQGSCTEMKYEKNEDRRKNHVTKSYGHHYIYAQWSFP